ncbi:hypothetical protein D3C85_501350 [compost metagenome]
MTSKITYEECEALVMLHQQGNKKATEALVHNFQGFLHKYVNAICHSRVNLRDKHIRHFMSLFMPKAMQQRIHQYAVNGKVNHDLQDAFDSIRKLFRNYRKQEIEQESVLAFLELATRYRNNQSKGHYFHTYLTRAFCFQFYRQLQVLAQTENLFEDGHIPFWDAASDGDSGVYSIDEIPEELIRHMTQEFEDEINENWVNGITNGDVFDDLSRTQRRIIKLHYVDGLTDGEISDNMGVCRATINRNRLKSIKMVAGQMENLNLISPAS